MIFCFRVAGLVVVRSGSGVSRVSGERCTDVFCGHGENFHHSSH